MAYFKQDFKEILTCKNQVIQPGLKSCCNFFPVIAAHVTSFIEVGACILKRSFETVEN